VSAIQNLRIGTKLAVTSLLSILLVGAMIWAEMEGAAQTREASDLAARQSNIVQNAIATKASARGMVIAGRDVRLAQTAAEIQVALRTLEERQKATNGFVEKLLELMKVAENRARAENVKELAHGYVDAIKEIATIRADITAIEQKRGAGGELPAGLASQYAALEQRSVRLADEKSVPTAAELDSVVDKNVEFSGPRAEEARTAASQAMAAAEVNLLVIGVGVRCCSSRHARFRFSRLLGRCRH